MFRLRYVLTFLKRVMFVLRVGVIGLGHMGQLHLLNALRIDGVSVVAAADKSARNRKYMEKYHVKTYDDYSKLIDAEDLDAVIISLPNFLKKEGVFYAAENKLDIFLDKPLSRNFAEAQEIVRKVNKENVRLMVGVNYRYFPCVKALKKNLDDGLIGDAVTASSELVLNGPISHAVVPVPVAEWWLSKEMAGGGALLDLGYHLIDLLSWMLGDLKVGYSRLGHTLNLPVEDAATVVLESKDKYGTFIVNVGWFSKSIFPDFNFRVNIHGTVGFDSTDRYIPRNPRAYAAKEGLMNVFRKVFRRKLHYLSYTYYYSSFYTLMDLFFAALKQGIDFPISLEKQLDVIKIIDSVYCQNEVK
jgi:myo-inositol 2-dehydrogenase/D-chiro-inositol 1-dehydrogenase